MRSTFVSLGMFFAALAASNAVFAESPVYRTQEPGEVIFSDQAQKNSKKLNLPPVNTHEAPKVQVPSIASDASDSANVLRYQVQIMKPENVETIVSSVGEVSMDFSTQPDLVSHAGHRLRWSLGKLNGETTDLNVRISAVDRGTHTISVSVVDAEGLILSNTSSRVFHLVRPSVNIQENLKKSNQQAPRAP